MVSRAYYAAFWRARHLYAILQGRQLPTRGSHKILWDALKERDQTREVGVLGERLKLNRVQADYRSKILEIHDLAQDAVSLSRDILEIIEGRHVR